MSGTNTDLGNGLELCIFELLSLDVSQVIGDCCVISKMIVAFGTQPVDHLFTQRNTVRRTEKRRTDKIKTSHVADSNFIVRILYKDMYSYYFLIIIIIIPVLFYSV